MSTPLPHLILKSQSDRRIKLGHLWVFSNEVNSDKTSLKNFTMGQQVVVMSNKGAPLGVAFMNPTGLICARIINRDSVEPFTQHMLAMRLKQALALRELAFPLPYYRLVYGDSDLLPGLVVDRYGDYLVVQISSAGLESFKDDIISSLVELIQPKGILLNNDHSGRSLENLPSYSEVAYGEVPEYADVIENGTKFHAPILAGQKTGWFYDHRINRQHLQSYVKGKRVLDVFSYIGGWGLQALTAGAAEATCVDASEQALACVTKNAELNGFGQHMKTIHGKAIDVLKQLIAKGETYDVVVLDPPAFIKKRKDQRAGEAAYRHINELAMQLLGNDGLLVSGSCSMHLANDTLVEIVRAAGRHLGKHVQIIWQGGQGADHPIHPAIPQTDYLKAVFARVYKD